MHHAVSEHPSNTGLDRLIQKITNPANICRNCDLFITSDMAHCSSCGEQNLLFDLDAFSEVWGMTLQAMLETNCDGQHQEQREQDLSYCPHCRAHHRISTTKK